MEEAGFTSTRTQTQHWYWHWILQYSIIPLPNINVPMCSLAPTGLWVEVNTIHIVIINCGWTICYMCLTKNLQLIGYYPTTDCTVLDIIGGECYGVVSLATTTSTEEGTGFGADQCPLLSVLLSQAHSLIPSKVISLDTDENCHLNCPVKPLVPPHACVRTQQHLNIKADCVSHCLPILCS